MTFKIFETPTLPGKCYNVYSVEDKIRLILLANWRQDELFKLMKDYWMQAKMIIIN